MRLTPIVAASPVVKGWPGFSLRADRDGFTMRFPLGRSRFRWDEIDGDFVVSGRYVGFRLLPSAHASSTRWLFAFQRALVGVDAAIDARAYRMDVAGLQEWLTVHRYGAAPR